MSKLRKYKNDHNDLIYLTKLYLDYKQCVGGRLVHMNYSCAHCRSSDPFGECLSPNPEYAADPPK